LWVLFEQSGLRRLRAGWRLLAQYLAFDASRTILASLLATAVLLVGPGGARSWAFLPMTGVASLIAVLISVWAAGRLLDRRPIGDYGLRVNGGWLLDLGFGVALGALLMTAIFLVQLSAGWISVTGSFRSFIGGTPFALAVLVPLFSFVLVGFYEELLSRGYQLRNLAEGLNFPELGPRAAVLLAWISTSAFFGLLHAANPSATPFSTFNIFLAGLMLGLGYVLTGRLAVPIGLHLAWNFFQGNVFGFPVSGIDPAGASVLTIEQGGPDLFTGGSFGPEAGLLGVGAMVSGALLILLWSRLTQGSISIHTLLAEPPKEDPGVRPGP
jgi:membrane protease YdiL (CAAX protease family)